MTAAASSERALAIAVADGTCPRCGAARHPDQRYCLQCGLALPQVSGRLPAMRRRWLRRLGWYPGDWVWVSLATLLVAAAAAAAAVAVSEHRHARHHAFATVLPAAVAVNEPTAPALTATTARRRVDTSKLPTPPEPGRTAPGGRIAWPKGQNGWTIVLVSYPKTFGRTEAVTTAKRAVAKGLNEVGVIDSSLHASLQPGYLVVFTGVYGSKADADAAVATARQAGFAGAYSREIAG